MLVLLMACLMSHHVGSIWHDQCAKILDHDMLSTYKFFIFFILFFIRDDVGCLSPLIFLLLVEKHANCLV
jgi:hypothetical protein